MIWPFNRRDAKVALERLQARLRAERAETARLRAQRTNTLQAVQSGARTIETMGGMLRMVDR